MILTGVTEKMSARKALSYIGASNNMLYYPHVANKKSRTPLDNKVKNTVKKISTQRPAYGTRRLAAAVSRELKKPVNRKQIQRICRKTGLVSPVTTKKEAVAHGSRKVKTSRPYEI